MGASIINSAGLLIGVVALVLSFPISVAASLAAPKISNWWSQRSRSSLKRRVEELEYHIDTINGIFVHGAERINARILMHLGGMVVDSVRAMVFMVLYAVAAIQSGLPASTDLLPLQFPGSVILPAWSSLAVQFLLMINVFYYLYRVFDKASTVKFLASINLDPVSHRKAMEGQVDSLKYKLNSG